MWAAARPNPSSLYQIQMQQPTHQRPVYQSPYFCIVVRCSVILRRNNIFKGVFIATQLNSIQLNSTDPVEQRTAKSVVFLFMTSRLTN